VTVLSPDSKRAVLPPDSDRPLHQLRRQLEDGKEITLIGTEGRPLWSRWSLGQGKIEDDPERGNAFSVSSQEMCLLELLPDAPRRGYRLRGLVSHLSGPRAGEVGLYFGYREYPTGHGLERRFCTLTFNDIKASIPLPSSNSHQPTHSAVQVKARRYWEQGPSLVGETTVKEPFVPAALQRLPARPFRELMIEASPAEIQIYWERELLGKLTRAELRAYLGHEKLGGLPPDPTVDLDADFDPEGGMGLFLAAGWASFRQVMVLPLR
jgi:hypothetical protein